MGIGMGTGTHTHTHNVRAMLYVSMLSWSCALKRVSISSHVYSNLYATQFSISLQFSYKFSFFFLFVQGECEKKNVFTYMTTFTNVFPPHSFIRTFHHMSDTNTSVNRKFNDYESMKCLMW